MCFNLGLDWDKPNKVLIHRSLLCSLPLAFVLALCLSTSLHSFSSVPWPFSAWFVVDVVTPFGVQTLTFPPHLAFCARSAPHAFSHVLY